MPAKPLPSEDLDHILDCTRSIWEEVRGQRLFLTGGTGFFGCWLTESFRHINRVLDLRAQVTILTRNPAAFEAKLPHVAGQPDVTLLEGDVRSFDFPEGTFPFVIHAATEASAKQAAEEPLEMLTTILEGSKRVLDFAGSHGARKFLLTSSGAVYGPQPQALSHVPETYAGAPDPLDAGSVYSEGKRASELMCALYGKTRGFECKIARCWAFSGPHLPLETHFAIGNFIGAVLAGRPIQINGDGTPRRSYLYASDLTIWLWTMLFQAPALVAFNVGSAHDVSILELARAVADCLNPATGVHVAKEAAPGAPIARYVPAVDRARELLGLRETVSLQDGIRKTAAWYGEATGKNI